MTYSITSSAAFNRPSGTFRPSALAVLRLMTKSNLAGCCTGRSAGFSPLRMRSTLAPSRYCVAERTQRADRGHPSNRMVRYRSWNSEEEDHMRSISGWLRFCAASVVIAASTSGAVPARATDVIAEWSTIQMPPAPTLKQVTVTPRARHFCCSTS